MQCKDISDLTILQFLADHQGQWCFRWGDGPRSIRHAFPPNASDKLVGAKMGKLIKRGLVSGCACGCRGDFEITEKGLTLLRGRNQMNTKIYEHEGVPVEFAEVNGDVYVFYACVSAIGPMAKVTKAVVNVSIARLPGTFGQGNVCTVSSLERKTGKNRMTKIKTPLIHVTAMIHRLQTVWQHRKGAADLAAFLELCAEDFRKTVLLRTPPTNKKPTPVKPEPVQPSESRVSVSDRVDMLISEVHALRKNTAPVLEKDVIRLKDEYGPDDLGHMAELVESIRESFLFSFDDAGLDPVAAHFTILALNQLDNAVQKFKLAELYQAKALGEQRG